MASIYKPLLFIVSIAVLLAASSCKKSDTVNSQFPKTLTMSGITLKEDARVFTKNGEITDATIKAKSIESTGLNLISAPTFNKDASITFVSRDTLKIGNDYFKVDYSNNAVVFRSMSTHYPIGNNTEITFAPFFKVTGLSTGPKGEALYNLPILAYGDLNTVAISQMNFCLLKRDDATNGIVARYVEYHTNELNPAGISALGLHDTLAIKTYSMIYK